MASLLLLCPCPNSSPWDDSNGEIPLWKYPLPRKVILPLTLRALQTPTAQDLPPSTQESTLHPQSHRVYPQRTSSTSSPSDTPIPDVLSSHPQNPYSASARISCPKASHPPL